MKKLYLKFMKHFSLIELRQEGELREIIIMHHRARFHSIRLICNSQERSNWLLEIPSWHLSSLEIAIVHLEVTILICRLQTLMGKVNSLSYLRYKARVVSTKIWIQITSITIIKLWPTMETWEWVYKIITNYKTH